MTGDLRYFRSLLDQKKGAKAQIENEIEQNKSHLKQAKRDLINTEAAQVIIQKVAQQTQQELEFRISELVSLALASVFDDPYKLEIDFVVKRGKTEAEIYFVRNGERIDPLQASGGGPVDIASFALRIALWNLARPKSRNTIILDEPFRFISRDLQPKASEMLKMISKKLGIQFIMVSHSPDLIQSVDRVFETKLERGVTKCLEKNYNWD